MQKKFQQLEEQIGKLNQRKLQLEQALADPTIYTNGQNFANTESDYKKVTSEIAIHNVTYEELFEKILNLEEGQRS